LQQQVELSDLPGLVGYSWNESIPRGAPLEYSRLARAAGFHEQLRLPAAFLEVNGLAGDTSARSRRICRRRLKTEQGVAPEN
jgi:hypothetical protein